MDISADGGIVTMYRPRFGQASWGRTALGTEPVLNEMVCCFNFDANPTSAERVCRVRHQTVRQGVASPGCGSWTAVGRRATRCLPIVGPAVAQ